MVLILTRGLRHLFCACDAKQLVIVEADSGKVLKQVEMHFWPKHLAAPFTPTKVRVLVALLARRRSGRAL
jgi:hypothetical protein